MVSKAKLYSKLDTLENQLREALIPHLETAANGGNDLVFCVTAFNPFRALNSKTDKLSEELVAMGSQILSLREKLGESTESTIAERICWYCREWSDTKNAHRFSASRLAEQFLAEIRDEA